MDYIYAGEFTRGTRGTRNDEEAIQEAEAAMTARGDGDANQHNSPANGESTEEGDVPTSPLPPKAAPAQDADGLRRFMGRQNSSSVAPLDLAVRAQVIRGWLGIDAESPTDIANDASELLGLPHHGSLTMQITSIERTLGK